MFRFFLSVALVFLSFTLEAKNVLVTGGAGLIGSHLCDNLLQNGHTVICIDNLSTGSERNIQRLSKKANFHFIKHDICLPVESHENIDEIYNLACPASPPLYQKDPKFTLDTNYIGVRNMLELAKKHNAKFLQASTSEVYGDPLSHPQIESYWGNVNPIGIRSCYDEGKRIAETLVLTYRQMWNLDGKIVRIFNTYGPNMNPNDGRVISNFILQAIRNEPITVYGDGSQTRSICYVEDTVRGLIALMSQPKNYMGPVNIGNPQEMTILEIAQLILKLTGSNSEIAFLPLPQDDPIKRKPDISKARADLDWQPLVSPEEGILKTIQYFSVG